MHERMMVSYLWAERRVLEHDRAVAELLDQAVTSLDSCGKLVSMSNDSNKGESLTGIRDLGNLVAVEAVPGMTSTSFDEL
jgi:hypothetical protein